MPKSDSRPKVAFFFLAVVAIAVGFSAYSGWVAERPSNYFIQAVILALALGVSMCASRACWWILLAFTVSALAYTAFSMASGFYSLQNVSWLSWVNIGLESTVAVLLLVPPMIRWIGPFRG